MKISLRALERLREAVRHWRRCPVTITVAKQHATRSLDQNALYWVGYVDPIASYTGYTPLETHEYLKQRFLPRRRIVVADQAGVVVDEAEIAALTTTKLNKIEFGDYLREIENFALSLGVTVGHREAHA